VGQEIRALAGLPEPGEPVFYPKVGHCIYRGVTEDRVAPGTQLLELEDLEEGSRILIPLPRVPQLNLRPAGTAFQEIQEVLAAEFEEPLEDEDELHKLVETLITDGSPRALAQSLKRLHLLRQTTGLSREEEQTRKKIRSWLAAEVSISKNCTRAEAQAFMTRILQETMAEHEKKEKEEAKERRRAAREQKKAEEAAAEALAAGASNVADVFGPPVGTEELKHAEQAEQAESATTVADHNHDHAHEPESTEPIETAKLAEQVQQAEPGDGVEPVEPAEPVESAAQTEVVPPQTAPGTPDVAPENNEATPRRAEEESPSG
jgi:RNA polymerase-interacting CarD/CdnL/TRCF family regulator